jgi:hypothetical protein
MNERPLYQIVDWDRHFENFRSRVVDQCTFVCFRNQDTPATSAITNHPDSPAIFGVWHQLGILCSRHGKPRHGYITTDGTREGWRLTSEELAHMWKFPASRVRHALAVLSSPQVRLIKLITGAPELAVTIPEASFENDTDGIARASSENDTNSIARASSENDTDGIARASSENDAPADDEGRKEGTKERILSKERSASPDLDPLVHSEAKRLLSKLSAEVFDEPIQENQWTYKMDYQLAEALPMKREDWRVIDHFYRLPDDHEIFTVTRKRNGLGALIENLATEPGKIRGAFKAIGRNGAQLARLSDPVDEATPEGWKKAAKKIYGPSAEVYPFKNDYPQSVQAELEEAAKEFANETQAA